MLDCRAGIAVAGVAADRTVHPKVGLGVGIGVGGAGAGSGLMPEQALVIGFLW